MMKTLMTIPTIEEPSLLTKLKKLKGLLGSGAITEWERKFLSDVVPKALTMADAGQVMRLSTAQLEVVDNVFDQHFAKNLTT
jgi:hypothetical protein